MDELVLNYDLDGNGPPLLIVHGFGISFHIWTELLPYLRPYFTLVMVELPGIGKSSMAPPGESYLHFSADALEKLRKTLGFETWDVFGYSTGSRIAEAYVQAYAAHVRRVIFLCPLRLGFFAILNLRFALWVDHLAPAFGDWLLRGWRLRFLISFFGFSLQFDSHVDEWHAEISAIPTDVLKETLRMAASIGMKPFRLPLPFSSIWGDNDYVTIRPRALSPGDAQLHATHAAPIVNGREVAEAILSILGKQG